MPHKLGIIHHGGTRLYIYSFGFWLNKKRIKPYFLLNGLLLLPAPLTILSQIITWNVLSGCLTVLSILNYVASGSLKKIELSDKNHTFVCWPIFLAPNTPLVWSIHKLHNIIHLIIFIFPVLENYLTPFHPETLTRKVSFDVAHPQCKYAPSHAQSWK